MELTTQYPPKDGSNTPTKMFKLVYSFQTVQDLAGRVHTDQTVDNLHLANGVFSGSWNGVKVYSTGKNEWKVKVKNNDRGKARK